MIGQFQWIALLWVITIEDNTLVAKNFMRANKNVLVHEGGFSDHPSDPGGATNQGITQRVYDSYRMSIGKKKKSVKDMTVPERDIIYKTRYWDQIKGDYLPSGIDYCLYDSAVHSGPTQAVKWLQRAMGGEYKGKVDGLIGGETIRAAQALADINEVIDSICSQRLKFMKALKTWAVFGRGWEKRVHNVRDVCKKWASGQDGQYYSQGMEDYSWVAKTAAPKAPIEDAKKAPPRGDAAAGAAVAAAATAAGGYFSDVIYSLAPFHEFFIARKMAAFFTVLAIMAAAIAIGYKIYAKNARKKIRESID